MSTTTDRIGLFKYDTSNSTDLASAFNINTALNNNWDKLDYCVTTSTKGADIGGLDQPVYVNSAGQIATCNAYDTISGGLTAEVSLSENGYIKFSSLMSQCLTFRYNVKFTNFQPIKFMYSLLQKYTKIIQVVLSSVFKFDEPSQIIKKQLLGTTAFEPC